jgi:hypothetical protein
METLNLQNNNVKAVTEAMNAVLDLDDGDYEFDTLLGPAVIRKSTAPSGSTRRNFYLNGSRIKITDLRAALRDAEKNPPETSTTNKEKDKEPEQLLSAKQLIKKYKKKKLLKVLPESGLLKKKKMAKLIDSIEKIAPKKIQGHEILAAIHAVKDNVKTKKIVALFDLL